jgi:hypothetical protein
MRRAEKAIIERADIDEILDRAEVGRMGTCADGIPYITPVNFVRRGDDIYFHSALEGRKIDNIRANPQVCFEVDEPLGAVVTGESACAVSYSYRCVIIQGRAQLVEDEAEKREALTLLLAKFEPGKTDIDFQPAVFDKTAVVRVSIEKVSGKGSFPRPADR